MSSLRMLNSEQEEVSTINHLNAILELAINCNTSDIHIEPLRNEQRIRFRIDGILTETKALTHSDTNRLIMRLKLIAGMDIAEKRLPQDGRLALQEWPDVHIRVSTCPAIWGEKIVLRLQYKSKTALCLKDLGMTSKQQQFFQTKLQEPHGLIIVAGPTGSGKTQTLFAGLNQIDHLQKNIMTLEDPVELELKGITQINIQPKIGLGFATLLRTILRQDPDVIMIGEVRDQDTAHIALQAARTGHLVLTTVHANTVLETIMRLQGLGIALNELQQISPLYISQRLVRCLCPFCKKAIVNQPTMFEPAGCHKCRNGYHKRTGIFEVQMSNFTALTPNNFENKNHVQALWNAGWLKVKEGITSLEELTRVLGVLPCY